jgi:hypothetical protein
VHGPRGKLEVAASLPESLPGNPDVSGPIPLELAAQVGGAGRVGRGLEGRDCGADCGYAS